MKASLGSVVVVVTLLLASCGQGASPVSTVPDATVVGTSTPTPVPSPQPPAPIPTQASTLSLTELKYRLLEQYPNFFFCDPDIYPVAHSDETQLALERFAELQANQEEFQAILAHNAMSGTTSFTDEQKLQIYRDHKKLAAILFEASGDKYQFQLQTADQRQGLVIKGLIDASGNITVQEKTATLATCPICLAAWTQIDTPRGAVGVADLKVGDLVWTVDAAGKRVAAPILVMGSVRVPATHEVVHLVLSDGRQLWASPGHPTADGRYVGDLQAGSTLDGGRVTLAERVGYGQRFTYDLLPGSATGWYWADGILLGSTLAP